MTPAERAVIEAALVWRRHVVIAGPPKYPRPRASGALADAIDGLLAERAKEWHDDDFTIPSDPADLPRAASKAAEGYQTADKPNEAKEDE